MKRVYEKHTTNFAAFHTTENKTSKWEKYKQMDDAELRRHIQL